MEKYSKYKDSGVEWLGNIPKHWDIVQLRNIAKKFTNGTTCEQLSSGNSDYKVSRIESISSGIIDYEKIGYLKNVKNLSIFLLNSDDFLISHINSFERIGNSAQYKGHEPFWHGMNLIRIEPQQNIAPSFLNYLLKSELFIGAMKRACKPAINQVSVPTKSIKSIKFTYPSKVEQNYIANFLDKKTAQIDEAIAIKQKQIELLKERKQIIIQKAVTQGLDPDVPLRDSGVDWIGEIPEHWEIKKLRYLGVTQNGISAGAEYFGSGHPFVSYGDVYNNHQLPFEVKGLAKSTDSDRKQYSIIENDVLFTRTSETIDEIGFASVCIQTISNSTFAGFLIRFRPKRKLFKVFSKYYFNSAMMREYFVKEMNLVIRASLSQELLKNLPVLLPPLEEQKQISNYLESVSTKIELSIETHEQQIKNLKEYKTTLINSAVTGKIKIEGNTDDA